MRILYILLRVIMVFWGLVLCLLLFMTGPLGILGLVSPIFHFWVHPSRDWTRRAVRDWVACLLITSGLFSGGTLLLAGEFQWGFWLLLFAWFTVLPLVALAMKMRVPGAMEWDAPKVEKPGPCFDY